MLKHGTLVHMPGDLCQQQEMYSPRKCHLPPFLHEKEVGSHVIEQDVGLAANAGVQQEAIGKGCRINHKACCQPLRLVLLPDNLRKSFLRARPWVRDLQLFLAATQAPTK